MGTISGALNDWKAVTTALPWGLQHTLHDTLCLVQEEKIKLVWGRDAQDGYPCLINAVNPMISDSAVNPASRNPVLVAMFDSINNYLRKMHINQNHFVSPLAAEILLRNFGTLKPMPEVLPEPHMTADELIELLRGTSTCSETDETTNATTEGSTR